MMRPVVHVAITSDWDSNAIERIAIRRSIAELVIVYPSNLESHALDLVQKFESLGLIVISVPVAYSDFDNTLSSILKALDDRRLDDYHIEFNVTNSTGIMTVAACVAAAIVKATVICSRENELFEIDEVWPSDLVNLTHRKRAILEYLSTQSEPIYQTEITNNTGVQRSGVSRHLGDLEHAGYVVRTRKAKRKYVEITNLGATVLHHKQLRKRRVWGHITDHPHQICQVVGRAHG
ncbi:MAG: helix-turn-helix transcriptional regulator [Candidatus Thorarchaeota archaeon]|jgi:DNA-binding MarR family transcriptional regulator